ncbi:hypothetical protein OAU31_03280 [Alphaproteobacteria bacterium]|nr:hypothetical protein [Alphaproteobacteria bacterium]
MAALFVAHIMLAISCWPYHAGHIMLAIFLWQSFLEGGVDRAGGLMWLG